MPAVMEGSDYKLWEEVNVSHQLFAFLAFLMKKSRGKTLLAPSQSPLIEAHTPHTLCVSNGCVGCFAMRLGVANKHPS